MSTEWIYLERVYQLFNS